MRKHPIRLAIGLALSSLLVGCGGGDDDSTTTSNSDSSSTSTSTQSTNYSVTAIDGYLSNAVVWLDVNGNYDLDSDEPQAVSGANGVADLDVTNVINYQNYAVLVKAIANQTVDADRGTITRDFVMSAPPGETDVTPLSTLVQLTMAKTVTSASTSDEIAAAKEAAVASVAASLGVDEEDILGDFIENGESKASYVAVNLVSSGALPEDESEAEEASDSSSSSTFDTIVEAVSTQIKTKVDEVDSGDGDYEEAAEVFDGSSDSETDSDQDGVADIYDAFPDDASEWLDFDKDGEGNNADTDDDDDGYDDDVDAFPKNASEHLDTDEDGLGNNRDTDDDGDGFIDGDDAFPLNSAEWLDTDNDGTGNNEDTDDDNDSYDDDVDAFPLDSSEWLDSDEDGSGDNADIDDDNDGYADTSDDFPNDATEWLDSDSDGTGNNADSDDDNDGYSDNEDDFPTDSTEWLDTDGDGTGNNSDDDDDNDGISDDQDDNPLIVDEDDTSGGGSSSGDGDDTDSDAITWLFNQSSFYIVDSDDDNSAVYVEQLDVSGDTAAITTIGELLSNGALDTSIDTDNEYFLSDSGWVTDNGYYTIERTTSGELTAYPTNYSEVTFSLTNPELIDVSGEIIADLADFWNQYDDASAVFSNGAYIVEVDVVPNQDMYYLHDDNQVYAWQGDAYQSDGSVSSISQVVVSTSAGDESPAEDFVGVSLGNNIGVEFLSNGTAYYYTIDFGNNEINRVASGSWTDSTISSTRVAEFNVPSAAKSAWGNTYRYEDDTLIISALNGTLVTGWKESANTTEEDDLTFVGQVTYDDLLANINIDITSCVVSDSSTGESPTLADFDSAVSDCGGVVTTLTASDIAGKTFYRTRSDGSTRQYTLNEDGSLYFARNGMYRSEWTWSIVDNYVRIVTDSETGDLWYWAPIDEQDGVWSFKFYETYSGGSEIWADTMEEVTSTVCKFDEVNDTATYAEFTTMISEYAACNSDRVNLTTDDIDGAIITGLRGGSTGGSTRSYEFTSSTYTYSREAAVKWSGNVSLSDEFGSTLISMPKSWDFDDASDNYIYILNEDNDSINVAFLSVDYVGDGTSDARATYDRGDIWVQTFYEVSDDPTETCGTGDQQWGDDGSLPTTTTTFSEYLSIVETCISDNGRYYEPHFSDVYVDRQYVLTNGSDTWTFNTDGSGTYAWGGVTYTMTWELDEENELLVAAYEDGVTEYLAITDTDGQTMALKVIGTSDNEGWPGLSEPLEGYMWSTEVEASYP